MISNLDFLSLVMIPNFILFSRCTFICHIGDCSDETLCKKKVKLYCPCKRRKQEMACNKAKDFSVKCDEECNQLKQKV